MSDVKNHTINDTTVYEFVDRLDKELEGEDFNKVINMMGKKIIDQNAYIDLIGMLVLSIDINSDQDNSAVSGVLSNLSMLEY